MAESDDEYPLQYTLRDAISSKDGMRVTFIPRAKGIELQQTWWDVAVGMPIVLDEQATKDLHMMLSMWLSLTDD